MLEHVVEVVTLHDHVVELEEGQTALHALLIALGTQHVVDREAGTHVTQQLHIVQVQQPVGVVQHQSLVIREVDELFHLLFKAGCIVGDVLFGQHLAHIGAAGGIADHGSASADQGDRLVACHLQALHQGQGHKMACGQAVGRAVKADIKSSLAVVDQINDLVVGDLCHQTTGLQLFVQSHRNILLFCGAEETKTPSAKHQFGRGREIFAVPPLFAASSQKRPHECTPQSRVTLLRL